MATDKFGLSWKENGTPVSERFDDPYFSIHDGLAETRHVFLTGNDLPGRLHDGFHIAELGFGTGLNLLAVAALAERIGVALRFTSFEAYPLNVQDIDRALAHWPEIDAWRCAFCRVYRPEGGSFTLGPVEVDLRIGLAEETLPAWRGSADAWFLDGFSPARNPALWTSSLMTEVGAHTAPGGTFATYTSAGHVRRSLTAAGFDVRKVAGYGRKREMSVGVRQA